MSDANVIEIQSVKELTRRGATLHAAIEDFAPDFVLVSSEDLSHVLLREAAKSAPGRIVHSSSFLPWPSTGSGYSEAH